MVKVATYFAMTLGAFVFWQSMEKIHVWIALHQDEKVIALFPINFPFFFPSLICFDLLQFQPFSERNPNM